MTDVTLRRKCAENIDRLLASHTALRKLLTEPKVERVQPCGCVVCVCGDNNMGECPECGSRCLGCGSRRCGTPDCVFGPSTNAVVQDDARVAYKAAPSYVQLRARVAELEAQDEADDCQRIDHERIIAEFREAVARLGEAQRKLSAEADALEAVVRNRPVMFVPPDMGAERVLSLPEGYTTTLEPMPVRETDKDRRVAALEAERDALAEEARCFDALAEALGIDSTEDRFWRDADTKDVNALMTEMRVRLAALEATIVGKDKRIAALDAALAHEREEAATLRTKNEFLFNQNCELNHRVMVEDADRIEKLEAALAASVPREVALLACRIAADVTDRRKSNSSPTLEHAVGRAYLSCYPEVAVAALARAEAEAKEDAGTAGKYRIGEKVFVDSLEGFGGEGTVVEYLPAQNKGHEDRYRIDLPSAGWSEPGVCWDHEISKIKKDHQT